MENIGNDKYNEKISFRERFCFGIGDFGTNLIYAIMISFLTYFYTDTVGISAALTGTIMFGTRIMDGFICMTVGTLMDKTHSKYGKARPWVIYSAIPFGIALISMSLVPADASYSMKVGFIVVTYVITNILFEISNIPYGTLLALITQDAYERGMLGLFRSFLSTFGSTLVGMITLPLVAYFGNDQKGWIIVFVIYGIVASIMLLMAGLGTKERVKPVSQDAQENASAKTIIKAVLSNKYWLIVFFYLMVYFVFNTSNATALVYFSKYVVHSTDVVTWITFAMSVPMLIMMIFVVPSMIKKYGKRKSAAIGTIVLLFGSLLPLLDLNNVSLLIGASVVKGIGNAPVVATLFTLLADTIDYGEWKSKIRIEGVLFSAGTVGQTLGMGLGSAVVGYLMGFSGYVSGSAVQSDSAINMIIFIFIGVPVIVCAIDLILLGINNLDNIYSKIVNDLQSGHYQEDI